MKKRIFIFYLLLLAVGVILLLIGLLGKQPLVTGLCIGTGTIIIGAAASLIAPFLSMRKSTEEELRIEMADERNTAIREKAAWRSGNILIPVMSVSALVLALTDEIAGACVVAGNLFVYSVCILFFSYYYNKKL